MFIQFLVLAVSVAGCTIPGGEIKASKKRLTEDCKDPDLSKLASDQSLTLCSGAVGTGTMAVCKADGESNCFTSASFPAAASTNLVPTNIKKGVTIGGVAGTKREIKQCRNAADLTRFDASAATNLFLTFAPAAVNTGTDVITLSAHGLITGDEVVVLSTTTVPAPLVSGTIYYAIVMTSTTIQLALSLSDALSSTPSNLTSQGVGFHTIESAKNGTADIWDTIDDENNNLASSPSNSPWDSTYVCGSDNFVNVSNTASHLTPSNTTPAGATAAFSQIWEDTLTGLYFTNILYVGSGSVTWAGAMSMCKGLNSGDGTAMWRLGTQKELMQLYIDGVSRLIVAGGTWAGQYMWSSSAVSNSTFKAWMPNLAWGDQGNFNRFATFNGVFCVR
jgi:hypothetical protein